MGVQNNVILQRHDEESMTIDYTLDIFERWRIQHVRVFLKRERELIKTYKSLVQIEAGI